MSLRSTKIYLLEKQATIIISIQSFAKSKHAEIMLHQLLYGPFPKRHVYINCMSCCMCMLCIYTHIHTHMYILYDNINSDFIVYKISIELIMISFQVFYRCVRIITILEMHIIHRNRLVMYLRYVRLYVCIYVLVCLYVLLYSENKLSRFRSKFNTYLRSINYTYTHMHTYVYIYIYIHIFMYIYIIYIK